MEERKPVFGPEFTCHDINRQLILMTPEIVAGEPVRFRIHLSRAKEKGLPPEFLIQRSFSTDINVAISPPKGRAYEYQGLNLGTNIPTATVKMEGFNYFNFDFWLSYDSESITGAALDMIGTYQLKVKLMCRSRSGAPELVDAGTFEVTVKEPNGDDAKALDIIEDYEVFRAFQLMTTYAGPRRLFTDDQIAMLEEVVEKAPEAALRPYAMLVLTKDYLNSGRVAEALLMARNTQREYGDLPVSETAFFDELRILTSQNQKGPAWKKFKDGWQDPSHTISIYPKSIYWNHYVKTFYPADANTQWMLFDEVGPDPEFLDQEAGTPDVGFPGIDSDILSNLGI